MNKKKLSSILDNHAKWVANKAGGVLADLSKAVLYRADLSGVNLSGANLSKADLAEADVYEANLSKADLRGTDLRGTDLRGTDLSGAYLAGADLFGADLRGASLYGTDLRKANLSGANLAGANLFNAKLSKTEEIRKGLILSKPMTGYKKTREDVVIKVKIPRGAIVFSINNSKCRTNMAEIVSMGRHKVLHSYHDADFEYRPGKRIVIKDFDLQYNVECAPGFHFFRTKEEAENY